MKDCNCNIHSKPFGIMDLVKCKKCGTLYKPKKNPVNGLFSGFETVTFDTQKSVLGEVLEYGK